MPRHFQPLPAEIPGAAPALSPPTVVAVGGADPITGPSSRSRTRPESGVTPAGDTGLASAPLGGTATVNVQLSLVRVA